MTNLSLSPTGKRIAVEARGEIFTIPADKGDIRNLSNSSGSAEHCRPPKPRVAGRGAALRGAPREANPRPGPSVEQRLRGARRPFVEPRVEYTELGLRERVGAGGRHDLLGVRLVDPTLHRLTRALAALQHRLKVWRAARAAKC